MTMQPVANLITLGARDFPSLRAFYRSLVWEQVIDGDDFAVFDLGALFLGVFPLDQLARDAGAAPSGDAGIGFSIGITVESADAVDELTETMRRAGARVTKDPVEAEFFRGRSAYLCDPEGHHFEITWADAPDNPIVIAAHRATR